MGNSTLVDHLPCQRGDGRGEDFNVDILDVDLFPGPHSQKKYYDREKKEEEEEKEVDNLVQQVAKEVEEEEEEEEEEEVSWKLDLLPLAQQTAPTCRRRSAETGLREQQR